MHHRGDGNPTVRLPQRHATGGVLPPPRAGPRADSGVQRAQHGSARTPCAGLSLCPNPPRGILVPVVALTADRAGCGLDVGPAQLRTNGPVDGTSHEGAASPRTGELVDLSHKAVVELYVHAHVLKLAPQAAAVLPDAQAPGCLPGRSSIAASLCGAISR